MPGPQKVAVFWEAFRQGVWLGVGPWDFRVPGPCAFGLSVSCLVLLGCAESRLHQVTSVTATRGEVNAVARGRLLCVSHPGSPSGPSNPERGPHIIDEETVTYSGLSFPKCFLQGGGGGRI